MNSKQRFDNKASDENFGWHNVGGII
jgi:hypothetical protein